MNHSIENRLAVLEKALKDNRDGVGLVAFTGKAWEALCNGQTQYFPSMDSAVAALSPRCNIVIIDDL